jgi:GNAT superfamily N-acetyltransferase
MVEIREMRSPSDLKRFVAFAETLYPNHPYYVPKLLSDELNTLRKDRNPSFDYCEARYWMAYKDGVPVGRIAGIISRRYIETWKKKRARFGWIEFVDDPEVSLALVGQVEQWAREQGLDGVHGPLGFCDMDREGMLVEGFDELDLLITNYNYAYYPVHMERLGYQKDVDWVEFLVTLSAEMPDNVDRIARIALDRAKLHLLRTRSKNDLKPYIAGIFGLINDTYKDLYSVVLLSDRQIEYYTKAFFGFINHEYVVVILDHQDRVAAFGVSMPSLSRALQKGRGRLFPFGFIYLLRALKRNDRLDLLLTAVRSDVQNKGINAVLINESWKAASKHGIKYAETGPELEGNEKIQAQWKHFDTRQHRRRRCFYKAITP